jgi:hypothetical protein
MKTLDIYSKIKPLVKKVYEAVEGNGSADSHEIWTEIANLFGNDCEQISELLNLCTDFEVSWVAPCIDMIVFNNLKQKSELIQIFERLYKKRSNYELEYETKVLQGQSPDYKG